MICSSSFSDVEKNFFILQEVKVAENQNVRQLLQFDFQEILKLSFTKYNFKYFQNTKNVNLISSIVKNYAHAAGKASFCDMSFTKGSLQGELPTMA